MTARDVLVRVGEARGVLLDGSPDFAVALLADLERDLARVAEAWPRCPACGTRAPDGELLHRHRVRSCTGRAS